MGRGLVYNNDLTESYEKISKDNHRLVKEFIQYCKSNDKSPQTIKQYTEWLKVFFSWNYEENDDKFFINLRKRDFVNYFGYLRDLDMSPNRIASLKSVLSSLSNEIELLYEDEYPIFKNQLRGMEAVHITKVREKTVLSTADVEKILDGLVDAKEYQVACFFALMCASGTRKGEMIQMKPSFFSKDAEIFNGFMYLTPEIRSKGRGKEGKKIKKYVIKETFKPYFDLWMAERKRLGIKNEYLFVTMKEGVFVQATISTANTFARRISKMFSIEFYNHSARHYFCTLLKSMELPDDIIAQIFSWESADLVKVYDDTPAEERLSKFFAKYTSQDNEVMK